MNSAPVGSQSYGSHPPGFSLKPGKAGIMELATAPKQSWRSSEESRILSALLVTRALLPWGYSGSSLRSWLSSPQSPRVEQRARVRGVWGGRGDSSAAENRGAQGIPRSRQAHPGRGAPGFPRRPVRGAGGVADPPAPRSRSRGGKQVGVEPAWGSRERRVREGCGRRPPRCGRCPPSGAPGPRPGHPGAVPARAHRSCAAWPSPGVPGGTPPAVPNHPGPPPTSRAAGAQEEEEKAAVAAAAPVRGRAERGRRRSARRGGRGRVCAPEPAPPSAPPRLPRPASPRLRHRHTPTKHPPPCAPAGRRAAGSPSERQLPRLEPLAFPAPSARRAEPGSIFFPFLPQPSLVWAPPAAAGEWGPAMGKGVKISEDYCSF